MNAERTKPPASVTADRLAEIRARATNADHAWPSNHAHYMPEPCAEILTGWLYPLAADALALIDENERLRAALEGIAKTKATSWPSDGPWIHWREQAKAALAGGGEAA